MSPSALENAGVPQMIVAGTPYRENSITAIARAAAESGNLDRFYTTLHTGPLAERLRTLPPGRLTRALLRELGRRAYAEIPSDRVDSIAALQEVVLTLARRAGRHHFSANYTFSVKAAFDDAMARTEWPRSTTAAIGMWGSAGRTLARAKRDGRLGVLNYVNSHPVVSNRLVRELGGAPSDHHELVPARMLPTLERELDAAGLVLAPSQFVARQLVEHGITRDRIAVEPYGVDLAAFVPPALPRRERKRTRLRVLSVAMITYRKGIRHAIEAARRLSDRIELDLVGPVVERLLLANLPENVRYRGVLVRDDVVAAMQDADVFVLPTVEDAFGLVVFEAMATALPAIVSDHAGVAEFVRDGETGFVVPAGDVNALAQRLEQLADDDALRDRVGEAGRRAIVGTHSWPDYAERVLRQIETRT